MQEKDLQSRLYQSIGRYVSYHGDASTMVTLVFAIYILYGIHKQYKVVKNEDGSFYFAGKNDALLHDLQETLKRYRCPDYTYDFYCEISKVPSETFEKEYVNILQGCLVNTSIELNREAGAWFSPSEITSLIAYFINKNECHSVYDPFCGMASIIHCLKDCNTQFVGQDINKTITLLARVNMEARYGEDKGIICADSIVNWNPNPFDAVVSCPPMGLQLSLDQLAILGKKSNTFSSCVPEFYYSQAFESNHAKIAISLEPLSFCFSSRYKAARHFLVWGNYLDTIILLPPNILYGTSLSCIMVICRRGRKKDSPVRFIHAESFASKLDGFRSHKIEVDRFIKAIEANDESLCVYTNQEEIINRGLDLNVELYSYKEIDLKDGQQLKTFGELFSNIDSELRIQTPLEVLDTYKAYPIQSLQTDCVGIWKTESNDLVAMDKRMAKGHRLYHSDGQTTYLLCDGRKMGLYSGEDDFVCSPLIQVLSVHQDLVTPEYLVYLIVNHPVMKTGGFSIDNIKRIPVAVDNLENQKEIVAKIKQEYARRKKEEQEAEVARLGVQITQSDLAHMLGTTFVKMNGVIKKLKKFNPDDSDYRKAVKYLDDNYNYLKHCIEYSYSDFSQKSFDHNVQDIVEFVKQYVDGWHNYGSNSFELDIQNDIGDAQQVEFDKTMLTVMLDSILGNAYRHSFGKEKREGNRVEISLAIVTYQDNPYVLLSIANNGKPFPSNFTLNDYISKGRYSATSGRSGLGGNHVYQIVKKHGGFLYLDSNNKWNVIVEVLLPVSNTNALNIYDYEHECV